jgi:hypothetical protein
MGERLADLRNREALDSRDAASAPANPGFGTGTTSNRPIPQPSVHPAAPKDSTRPARSCGCCWKVSDDSRTMGRFTGPDRGKRGPVIRTGTR